MNRRLFLTHSVSALLCSSALLSANAFAKKPPSDIQRVADVKGCL